jgi:hypothetical protein
MAATVKQPPKTKRYQLARLSLGNARSRAPIISGMTKFPIVVGTAGIRKNQTITTPWMVNRRLYVSGRTRSRAGVISSSRMSVAAAPPMKKKNVIEIR